MNDTRMTIKLKDREIILVGTAHVSRDSIREVECAIREEKPAIVCVELDSGRYASISRQDNWEKLDVIKVFREGKGFVLIANLVLAGFQRRMGEELGVKPGEEMKTAVETAKDLGVPFALCDREVHITLSRAWNRCGLWSKCKLLASLLSSAFTSEKFSEEEVERLKSRNELDGMMSELAAYLPSVKEVLIDERDLYLAAKIWEAGAKSGGKQLAVVGAGHLMGIRAQLEKIAGRGENVDLSGLDKTPPARALSKAAGWIIPLFIAAIIVLGFFRSGADLSLEMLIRWVLLNGSLAALGTVIALGHPLSVLVSFVGAPIATVNPFIGVGLFSGITEALIRKPRVIDTETLPEDICSLKGIYRNRITRALLVFFLSSLGGATGNFIAIPMLARLL
ncbi:MAG: TraB/GumN family protein [Treponema sp.]|jgi:pheromone shutdown-related protein TraB|nr:TraB/GumN family protein [Treponema sp.]